MLTPLHFHFQGRGLARYFEQLAVGPGGDLAVLLQQMAVGFGPGTGGAVEVVEAKTSAAE